MTDLLPEFVIQSRQENENLNAKLISTKIISEVDFGGKIDFQIYLLIISYLTEASINAWILSNLSKVPSRWPSYLTYLV